MILARWINGYRPGLRHFFGPKNTVYLACTYIHIYIYILVHIYIYIVICIEHLYRPLEKPP